jgi:hypothetical protein
MQGCVMILKYKTGQNLTGSAGSFILNNHICLDSSPARSIQFFSTFFYHKIIHHFKLVLVYNDETRTVMEKAKHMELIQHFSEVFMEK